MQDRLLPVNLPSTGGSSRTSDQNPSPHVGRINVFKLPKTTLDGTVSKPPLQCNPPCPSGRDFGVRRDHDDSSLCQAWAVKLVTTT